MRHFALFKEGLDSVGFDNVVKEKRTEKMGVRALRGFVFPRPPLRSKGRVVRDRGSCSATSYHPPPSSSCYYPMPTGSRRTSLTIMNGFL